MEETGARWQFSAGCKIFMEISVRDSKGGPTMDRQALWIFVLFTTLAVAACGGPDEDEIPRDVHAEVVELGSSAVDALVGTLVTRLSGAMSHGGAVSAIEFCSTSASELTAGVSAEQGLEVKRTSLRYRNPANAPDEAETEALRYFAAQLDETGSLPAEWVQRSGRDEYRYYRPLTVAAPCLGCHGTVSEIGSDVQAILDERYPEDQATDYAAGDFRGLVRVSIPAERVDPARTGQ